MEYNVEYDVNVYLYLDTKRLYIHFTRSELLHKWTNLSYLAEY